MTKRNALGRRLPPRPHPSAFVGPCESIYKPISFSVLILFVSFSLILVVLNGFVVNCVFFDAPSLLFPSCILSAMLRQAIPVTLRLLLLLLLLLC